MSEMKLQGEVSLSVEQAIQALGKVADKAVQMAAKTDEAAQKAGAAVDGIGDGASGSADQLTRAEGRMVASIKRVQTQMELAGKTASQKFEFNIAAKGLDASKFEPYLAQLRAIEQTQAKVAVSANDLTAKIGALAVAAYASKAAFVGIASSMVDAQQQAQKLRNSLEYAAGGAVGAAKEIQYLREVTNKLGLDFGTSSQAYAKFAAATKESGVSLAQTKTVFEGIAAASAKLGLSADETQGALLALSQMASKGTVSAEELRGQLGERLPGAFNIAAKSMGVTTAELGKMLETGQIMASDFLPKFGQALKDNFQAPLESLTQEINRFSSAWTLWKQELSEGANGSGFKWITNGLNESAAAMRALGKEAGVTARLLVAIGGFEAGSVGINKFNVAKIQEQEMKKLPEIRGQRQALENKDYLTQFEKQTLSDLKRQESAIRQSINDLAEQRGRETGINLPDLAGEYAAQQKKQTDTLNAYLKDISNAPKAAKLAAEVEKENTAFKVAVAGMSETDARYISALKAHNERVEEIQSKSKSAQVSHAKQVDALYGGAFLRQEESARIARFLTSDLKEINKAAADYAKSIEQLYAPIEREAKALEAQLQNYGLTRAEIEETTIARLEEKKAIEVLNAGSAETIANLEREISARKRIKEASAGIDARKASAELAKESAKAAEKAQSDWEKSSEKIGDSITDALMRGFESGKSFAATLKDTVVNMFKTMVLQPTIKVVVVGGMSAIGMGAASAAEDGGSSSSILGLGNSAANAYTGGTGGLYSAFANSGIGAGLGLSTGLAGSLGITGGASTIMGSSAALAAAEATSLAGASTLTSLGSTIGAAIPWAGLAVAVASMFIEKGGGPKTEGDYFGNIGSDGSVIKSIGTTGGEGKAGSTYWFTGNSADSQLETLAPTLGKTIFETVKLLGGNATGIGINYGYNTDPAGDAPDNIAAAISDKNGKYVYESSYNVDRGKSSEAIQLEFQKMTLAAVKAADGIQPLFKDIIDGIDLTTATAEQMTQTLSDVQGAVGLRKAFAQLGLDADALSVSLIKSAGGISALSTNLDGYYQNYFTEAERTAKLSDQVAEAFAGMNVSMPDSLAGFRAVVEGLDLTTASGQSTFAALMSVQSAFATVANSAASAASALSARAAANQEMQADRIGKMLDAQREAQLSAIEAQQTAFDSQVSAAQEVASVFDQILQSLSGYRKSLLLGESSTLSPTDKYAEAKRVYTDVANRAKLGDKDAAGQLQTVTDSFLAASKAASPDAAAYAIDFGSSVAALDQVIGTADRQKSIAQQQLDVAQAQLATLQSMAASLSSSSSSALPVVVSDFAKAAEDWQAWFDQTAVGTKVDYAGLGSSTRISADKGIFTDTAGNSYTFSQSAGAYELADQSAAWAAEMLKRYGTYKLPGFATGTNYVPQDMDVRVHEGEAILPKAYNPSAGGGNSALIAEIRALRAEVTELRSEQRAGNAAIASNTGKTAKTLDRAMPDGDALSVRVAA